MALALGYGVSFLLGKDLLFCGRRDGAYWVSDTDHATFTRVRFDPACGTAPPVHVCVGSFSWAVAFQNGSVLTQGPSTPPAWFHGRDSFPESMVHLPAVFGGDEVVHIACGDAHVLVVTSSGRVYARGANAAGQLGIGNKTNTREFQRVEFAGDGTSGIKSVACGSMHSLALTCTGQLYAWGSGGRNELGLDLERPQDKSTPILVGKQALRDVFMLQASAGDAHNAVIDRDGAVWVWGVNMDGQLGTGDELARRQPHRLAKADVFEGEKIKAVSCGFQHTLAASQQGGVWVWGNGIFGKLGNDTTQGSHSPCKIGAGAFGHEKVQVVAGGYQHSACITESGRVYTWGRGVSRQLNANSTVSNVPTGLGHADDAYVERPRCVPVLGEEKLAFAMCLHRRLGQDTPSKDLCPETVAMILGHVW
jgi:alpha-tubulin suppressor-like RCC1 family protein